MSSAKPPIPERVVFIADAHLGKKGETQARIENLAGFIHSLEGKVSHLYIVGDLFDFWFEYASVIPNTAPEVVFALYNLRKSGTEIIHLAGNHDYWLGPYMREHVGVKIIKNGLEAEHQGKKIFIHHGDGLLSDENGYKLLKKILRNRVSIFLFRLLHPDFAKSIASGASRFSRKFSGSKENSLKRLPAIRDLSDHTLGKSFDAVIFAHSHLAMIEKRPSGEMILLGDWIRHDTYAVLEDGVFRLLKYTQGEAIF